MSADHEEIVQSPKRLKSEVWAYFGFRQGPDEKIIDDGFPICRKCGKKVSAKGGNTSNLMAHLRDNHPLLYRECKVSSFQFIFNS